MTETIPRGSSVLPPGTWQGAAVVVRLGYDERFVRRRRLVTAGGRAFLLDLPETVSLAPGSAIALDDGSLVAVEAAAEPLLEVRGEALARLAWHIGNRHTPCQIEADRLLIREDHVLAAMLRGLGAEVAPLTAPFLPEGGAYGHGRTLGHDHPHGPDHDHGRAHDHDHAHDHEQERGHDHDHAHGHAHSHIHPTPDGRPHPVRGVEVRVVHRPGEDDAGPVPDPE
jgi:urease accessory protein